MKRRVMAAAAVLLAGLAVAACGEEDRADMAVCRSAETLSQVVAQTEVERPQVRSELLDDANEILANENCPGSDPDDREEDE